MTTLMNKRVACLGAVALLGLAGCGGGDSIEDAFQDAIKSVVVDGYEGSCNGNDWTDFSKSAAPAIVTMTVKVKPFGDVKDLTGEWFEQNDNSLKVPAVTLAPALGVKTTSNDRFTLTAALPANTTGDLSYRLLVRDKNGDERLTAYCKVHVK